MDPAVELAKLLGKYLGIDVPEGKEVETVLAALKSKMDKPEGDAPKEDASDKSTSRFDQIEAKMDAMAARMDEFLSAKKDDPVDDDPRQDADPDADIPDEKDKDTDVKMDSADWWLRVAPIVKKLGIPEKELAGKKARDVRNLCLARMDAHYSLSAQRGMSEGRLMARFDAELAHFARQSGVQSVIDRSIGHNGQSTGDDDGYSGSTFGNRLLKLKRA